MTRRKRIPQHLEYAIEDVAEQLAEISRLNKKMNATLTNPRGVNKYLLMAKSSEITAALAIADKALDRIERREGPPAQNGNTPAELTLSWLQMVQELLADEETPRKTLGVIVSRKLKEFR